MSNDANTQTTPAVPAPSVQIAQDSPASIEGKLSHASRAFSANRSTPLPQRADILRRAADILEANVEKYASLMVSEMGKTLISARAEVMKCAVGCRFYAEHGPSMLADEPSTFGFMNSRLSFQPLGIVLAIMPWNFPFWQVFRFAAPALMAGNAILLKHAPSVPGCSIAIQEILEQAGLAKDLFQSIFIDPPAIATLIADPRVVAVTLTGSEAAGRSVAESAGRSIKKVVLELGGSDPFIVMPSADRTAALSAAVRSRMMNNGQSCIAAKRVLLHESIYDEALQQLTQLVSALRIGDPYQASTDIGPLALERLAVHQLDQVQRAVAAGATIQVGGHRLPALGPSFFEPTILTGLPRTAPIAREEFFGPVMIVDRFKGLKDSVEIANDTPYGLAASVWTTDPAEQQVFADQLEVGQVFVNAMTGSDPRIPFGGTKRSGLGRELGIYGIREFTNVKAINFG